MKNIAVVGCGVMGSAFARYFAKKNRVRVFDKNGAKAALLAQESGIQHSPTLEQALQGVDVILLAIKPKDLKTFAENARGYLSEGQLLLSVLAGIPLEVLEQQLPHVTLLRTMPNLPLICGKGVIGVVDHPHLTEEVKGDVNRLLEGVGLISWQPESKIDALTALSGSGPAFVYVILEAMIEAGISMGLTAKESELYAVKMMEGATALLQESGKHPAELKWQIASPAGTTIAGLNVLEEKGVRGGIIGAFQATFSRAQKL